MPTRRIPEAFRTSRLFDNLSLEAESLYWRLWTLADDFGFFDADPVTVRSLAYPRKANLKLPMIAKWLAELVAARLVCQFDAEGQKYGHFTELWKQANGNPRAIKSKFPACTNVHNPAQPCANVPVLRSSIDPDYDLRITPPSPLPGGNGHAASPCPECVQVLDKLNDYQKRTGMARFRVNGKGVCPGLHDRHKEHGVEVCLKVVRVVGFRLWSKPETKTYSRPATLFGPKNFTEKYLPEAYAALAGEEGDE